MKGEFLTLFEAAKALTTHIDKERAFDKVNDLGSVGIETYKSDAFIEVIQSTNKALKEVEKAAGKEFGNPKNPLLVSCRSGAKMSMPGMMDTVLNIGLNDKTVEGMVKLTENERFVYDAYRRLIAMYGSVVLGISDEKFEKALDEMSTYKQIEKISVIAGQYDIIVRVAIENLEELLEITNTIQMINGVEKTTTQIIEKEIIL